MLLKRLLNSVLLKKRFELNKCQIRSGYFEGYRSGDKKIEDKREAEFEKLTEWDKITTGYRVLKHEIQLWRQEVVDQYSLDVSTSKYANQEVVKLWDFDQRNNEMISSFNNNKFETNDMNRWRTACDSDYNEGYSRCDWTVSPSGRGLFSGYLDTKLPNDGNVIRSGFAFLGCEKHRRSFYRQNHFDWADFTHLLVRVRGDGRNYFIVLNVSDDNIDLTWFDRYQFVLYTHGGPYWQWCKIPFSRFYFQSKSFAQEVQHLIPLDRVSQIGFLLADQNTGPFNLEIDYVGAMKDENWTEDTAYESYFHMENRFLSPATS